MKIITLADIHGDVSQLNKISKKLSTADLILLCGDITQFGKREAVQRVVKEIRSYNPNLLAVTGNCDYPEVEDYLLENGLSLNKTCKTYFGVNFIGISGSLPCPGPTPNELTENEFASGLEKAFSDIDPLKPTILVTHQPPAYTGADQTSGGFHIGSKSIRDFIENHKIKICFCGHVHESRTIDTLGITFIINPGRFYDGYVAEVDISGSDTLVEFVSIYE